MGLAQVRVVSFTEHVKLQIQLTTVVEVVRVNQFTLSNLVGHTTVNALMLVIVNGYRPKRLKISIHMDVFSVLWLSCREECSSHRTDYI